MHRLSPIEQECQDVLVILFDLMGAGHRKLGPRTQLEIMALVRNALVHLKNKEFGCTSGRHSGACECKGDA